MSKLTKLGKSMDRVGRSLQRASGQATNQIAAFSQQLAAVQYRHAILTVASRYEQDPPTETDHVKLCGLNQR